MLRKFSWSDDKFLLSIDGSGLFASRTINCQHCCVKKRKSGGEFYHQFLAAAIVHPDLKQALPLDFEPIARRDGNTKNDCERNAGKRSLNSIRQQYPDRQFVVREDALAANGPHIQKLLRHRMDFIIGTKPGSNAALFVEVCERLNRTESAPDDLNKNGFSCGFRSTNEIALNGSYPDWCVNFVEYWRFDKKGKLKNLPSIAEHCRALPSIAEHCRALPSIAEHCRALPSIAEHCRQVDGIQKLACRLFQEARGA